VLEYVPDHDLVEALCGESCLGETVGDSNVGSRVAAADRVFAHLHTEDVEAAVREGSEEDASAATDIENRRSGRQIAR
jgi:hypothetical protein